MVWVLSLSPQNIIALRLPPWQHARAFGVWLGVVSLVGSRTHPVLYLPCAHFQRPYQNRFRGEPAISELDWPFTPILNSSERFSTHIGSVLHALLRALQPGQG